MIEGLEDNGDLIRIVSVSGGKDSTALLCWAKQQWGKDGFISVFADTGHEHPVTYNYVRNLPEMVGVNPIHWVDSEYNKKLRCKRQRVLKKLIKDKVPLNERHRELERFRPTGNPFLDMCLWKGRVPSTKAQFCTEHLKLKPIKEWVESIRGDCEIEMYVGIRGQESPRRAKMPEKEFSEFYDGWVMRPLLHWTQEQVFDFLNECVVPPNPLYALGYGRVGCFPCIHANKGELSRLPDWAWEKLEEWENKIGRSWFSAGTVPGIFIPTINDVREWAKTSHGGRQKQLFPPDQKDVPSCMSTWGICE